MRRVSEKNADQRAFLQAVEEVATDVLTVEKANSAFAEARVLECLTEPDRQIAFRVHWEDDNGELQTHRGWRVQTSNAIGPYKGGIRFDPTVTPSVLKFLGFEQVFKNALTGLPLGAGKGGADFDAKGRSTREIGSMFGAYKRQEGRFHDALTGKGGSEMPVQATGYGVIYFLRAMLANQGEDIADQRIAISGTGNGALHAAQKAIAAGGRVVSLSHSGGTILAQDGLSGEALDGVRTTRSAQRDITGVTAHPRRRLHLTDPSHCAGEIYEGGEGAGCLFAT